ncbi:MAG: SpoIID/LytB domain-containing protein [Anaerolineae bacterium]
MNFSIPATIRVLMPNGTVKTVNLEAYVAGVVAATMPADAPLEALKAQAVAARTFGAMTRRHIERGAEVCAQRHCQIWQAIATPIARQAAHETESLVAVHGGRLIDAYYFEHCDGNTRDAHGVLIEPPAYLQSVSCACGLATLKGHGIGMCQRGALVMARFGDPFEVILKHYYTGIIVAHAVTAAGAATPDKPAPAIIPPSRPAPVKPATPPVMDGGTTTPRRRPVVQPRPARPPVPPIEPPPSSTPSVPSREAPPQAPPLVAPAAKIPTQGEPPVMPATEPPPQSPLLGTPATEQPAPSLAQVPIPTPVPPLDKSGVQPGPSAEPPIPAAVEPPTGVAKPAPPAVANETSLTSAASTASTTLQSPPTEKQAEAINQPTVSPQPATEETRPTMGRPRLSLDDIQEPTWYPLTDELALTNEQTQAEILDEALGFQEELTEEPLVTPEAGMWEWSIDHSAEIAPLVELPPPPDSMPEDLPLFAPLEPPEEIPPPPLVEEEMFAIPASVGPSVLVDSLPGPRIIAGDLNIAGVIVTIRDAFGNAVVTVSGTASHHGPGGFEAPLPDSGEYKVFFEEQTVPIDLRDETIFITYST